jgi:hypothetical protein
LNGIGQDWSFCKIVFTGQGFQIQGPGLGTDGESPDPDWRKQVW